MELIAAVIALAILLVLAILQRRRKGRFELEFKKVPPKGEPKDKT